MVRVSRRRNCPRRPGTSDTTVAKLVTFVRTGLILFGVGRLAKAATSSLAMSSGGCSYHPRLCRRHRADGGYHAAPLCNRAALGDRGVNVIDWFIPPGTSL